MSIVDFLGVQKIVLNSPIKHEDSYSILTEKEEKSEENKH